MATPPKTKRRQRTSAQQIADLRAQIARIKAAKTDPARAHVARAVREIEQGMKSARDPATRDALGVARTTLLACMMMGESLRQVRAAIRGVELEEVERWIAEHPGHTSAEIAEAMGADVDDVRLWVTRLRRERRLSAEGLCAVRRYYARSGAVEARALPAAGRRLGEVG